MRKKRQSVQCTPFAPPCLHGLRCLIDACGDARPPFCCGGGSPTSSARFRGVLGRLPRPQGGRPATAGHPH